MPPGCTLDDLQLFIYSCERRDLDPLLSESYCRRQFDRDSGEYKLLLLDGYHGLLKSADKTGEMDGIKTTFQEDNNGNITSATTFVWRKNCAHPFEFTAYWGEFVGMSNGKPSYMWATKGHVMLGKCSAANALRLAFAAALAGVFVPEELDHTDNSPAEPDSEFAVGELQSEVETAPDSQVQRLDPDVDAPKNEPTPGPQVGTTRDPIIAQTPEKKEKIDAPAMPINLTEVKATNSALVQRLMLDLQISKAERVPLLTEFYRGYLGVAEMPKGATVFTPALRALSAFADSTRAARIEFVADPKALGARLRADKEFENATA